MKSQFIQSCFVDFVGYEHAQGGGAARMLVHAHYMESVLHIYIPVHSGMHNCIYLEKLQLHPEILH